MPALIHNTVSQRKMDYGHTEQQSQSSTLFVFHGLLFFSSCPIGVFTGQQRKGLSIADTNSDLNDKVMIDKLTGKGSKSKQESTG